jgi:proteasome lid subunit RPN8/RPN11
MLELAIPRDIFDKMLKQAADEAPMEACGILAGKSNAQPAMS